MNMVLAAVGTSVGTTDCNTINVIVYTQMVSDRLELTTVIIICHICH